MSAKTLYDKLWDSHVVSSGSAGSDLLYIDRHLLHEVSTPQSFAALAERGCGVRRLDANLAVADHSVPTLDRQLSAWDPMARAQVDQLIENCRAFGIDYIPLDDKRHGIVHVIGPELGFTVPGATLVCGDSHTSTHGAFGALAFGIGASDCAVVMATQCLRQTKTKRMLVRLSGAFPSTLSSKDIALALIGKLGSGGGTGYAIEYAGEAVSAMSMAARMTLCNLSIECGARVGLIAPDETTFAYLKGRPMAPQGPLWGEAVASWRRLATDAEAAFEKVIEIDVSNLEPHVTWGTSPEDAASVTALVPDPADQPDEGARNRMIKALDYMGLKAGTAIQDIAVDRVFIGSCTNSRIEDLRAAADIVRGRTVADTVVAIVAPGSASVKRQAEREGLDAVFLEAGFEWREAGCSMCVAMNGDKLDPGQRCASTSNRNFEGRQGQGGRTHLMSPAMAAAAAVTGHLCDVRQLAQ